MSSVNAALIIDTSGSMSTNGYVNNTVIDSKAFASYALAGDAIGVVNFNSSASIAYGPNSALAVVDSTLSQPAAAAAAINGLQFGGSTCIGCGIQTANTLLATGTSGNPTAAVLFTDGYQNSGTNPLTLPPTYPVFSCAMGANSNQSLIQQIATQTGGVYYYMPYPIDMMRIFNQIRAIQTGTQTSLNYIGTLSSSNNSLLLPVVISAGSATNQIGVVWNNTSYAYTSSTSPVGNQISILIYQPDGTVLSGAPAITGSGYVVFNTPSPAVGTWNIYLEYPGSSTSLSATAGAFELSGSTSTAMLLHVEAPQVVTAGQPIEVGAHVTDGGQPVEGLQMTAHVVQPRISVANALQKHKDQLAAVRLPEGAADGKMDPDRARLEALRNSYLPSVDILSHRSHGAVMRQVGNDRHALTVPDTREAGSYNVTVNVTGYSKRSKTPFQRTHLATVLVR